MANKWLSNPVQTFTIGKRTPPERPMKTLVFIRLKFDGAPNCHVFEPLPEHFVH
jgi:hypothetical protein